MAVVNNDLQEAVDWTIKIDDNLMGLIQEIADQIQKDPNNEFLFYVYRNLVNKRKNMLELEAEFGPKADPSMKDIYINRKHNQGGLLYEMDKVVDELTRNPEACRPFGEEESPLGKAFK